MTGPEHYRCAEDDMHTADALVFEGDDEGAQFALARAQVHATLAQAAATADVLLGPVGGNWEGMVK